MYILCIFYTINFSFNNIIYVTGTLKESNSNEENVRLIVVFVSELHYFCFIFTNFLVLLFFSYIYIYIYYLRLFKRTKLEQRKRSINCYFLSILGYLHKLGGNSLHLIMHELAATYGDIFSLKLGSRLTVVLSSRESIHELYIKKAKLFGSRPNFVTFMKTNHGAIGLSFMWL